MTGSEYDTVVAEVYGTADEALRARYGPLPKRRKRSPTTTEPPKPRDDYRVTSHARIKCACSVYVYTEQRGNRPAVFPAVCWRCEQPLDFDADRS